AAESQTHRAADEFRDSSDVMDQERAFGHRRGYVYLIDLLLGAPPQVMQVGAAGDGNDRAFAVHGVGQTGDRVGKTWRGVHANTRLLGDSPPTVRHVDRRLLVTRIDDAEVLIHRRVQHR